MYNWICPQCRQRIGFPNELSRQLAERAGGCQGCRAAATFRKRPELAGMFIEFWARVNGYPVSPSWMRDLQLQLCA